MGNGDFESLEQINDVQAIGTYNDYLKRHKNENKAFFRCKTGTRDNARTPFHWSDTENAGFTAGEPWMKITKDYRRYNAQNEANREDSVLNFYKKAIALRKDTKALVYGEFIPVENMSAPVYCYYREYNGEKYFVELNLGKKQKDRAVDVSKMQLILSTRGETTNVLKPFEGNIYRVK